VNADKPVVLIIDDHADIRKVMALLLQKDFNAIQSDGDESVVSLAAQKQPALILCDGVMPRIGGKELVTRLRANPQTSHIPILVVSGKTTWEDWSDQEVTGLLPKPFTAEELIDAVWQIIKPDGTLA